MQSARQQYTYKPSRGAGGTSSTPFRITSPPISDRDRLLALARGDESAYDAIFRAHYVTLVRAIAGVVREVAVAEELAQDVMLELWRRRSELDPAASLQGYLLRAGRNRALNHLRHQRIEERDSIHVDPPAAEPMASSQLVASELAEAARLAIAELPPRCREVFELSRTNGLRYSEIAEQLGISVKAVEAQMGRALRTMRERLAPWLPDGGRF